MHGRTSGDACCVPPDPSLYGFITCLALPATGVRAPGRHQAECGGERRSLPCALHSSIRLRGRPKLGANYSQGRVCRGHRAQHG